MLEPGADVIALGFGQAFTDLVALVSEGRGGRYETGADGHVTYHPSGDEPILHVGSRRGVPYRSKLEYRLQGPPAPMPRFLDDDAVDRLLATPHLLQFRRDIYPLVAKEVGWAYYHELFVAHGERTSCDWDTFAERYAAACTDDELAAVVTATVPDARDHFSIPALDRPLAGLRFASTTDLHGHVAAHVAADVARRTNPAYSADLGAFLGLLWTFGTIGRIGVSGQRRPPVAGRPSWAPGGSASSCTTPAVRRRPGCASSWRSPTPGWFASSAPAPPSRPTPSRAGSWPTARATTTSSSPRPTSTPASPPPRSPAPRTPCSPGCAIAATSPRRSCPTTRAGR